MSKDAKWIIGTLLVLTTVVLAAAGVAWDLGRTLATKSDLDGLATSAEVEALDARLNESTEALENTVGDLQTAVGNLQATVGSLEVTAGELRTAVSGIEETTEAVHTLIGVTLPAFFACMIELDRVRYSGGGEPGSVEGRPELSAFDRPDFPGAFADAAFFGICAQLAEELAAVDTSLVPRLSR